MSRTKTYEISLKRRKDYLQQNDIDDYQYMMFGHFDGMDVKENESWDALIPGDDIRNNWNTLDEFLLKGMLPNNTETQKENKEVVYVIITLINIDDEIVFSSEVDSVENLIEANIKKINSGNEFQYTILPSISYQDIIILFYSNELCKVQEAVDSLRTIKFRNDNTKKQQALITNIYTIMGINVKKFESDKRNMDEIIEMSIRIILKEGISVSDFNVDVADIDIVKYHMFGSSDVMFTMKGKAGNLLGLFTEGGIFNPGNSFFQTYICHIRSSIKFGCNDKKITLDDKSLDNKKEEEKKYDDFANKLKELFENTKKDYIRYINSLNYLYKLYLNLVQSNHSDSIKVTVGKAFDIFMENISSNIDYINNPHTEEKEEFFEKMCQAIELFKDNMTTLLCDLRRSDRMFIEEASLIHPSVASATKLVLFYDEYINKLGEEIQTANKEADDKREYHFLIMSGGTNIIVTSDVFAYMDPWDKSLKKLIFVFIPERQLFDYEKSIFALAHECAHFCGNRKRMERTEYFIDAVSTYISNRLVAFGDALFNDGWKKIIEELIERRVSAREVNKFHKNINKIQDDKRKIMHEKICKYICPKLKQDISREECGHYFAELNKRLSINFLLDIQNRCLVEKIYNIYLNFFIDVISDILDTLYSSILFSQLQFDLEKLQYYKKQNKNGVKWSWLQNSIDNIIEYQFGAGDSFDIEFESYLKVLSDVFKECYCDFIASKMNGVTFEKFIFGFLDRDRSLEESFPIETTSILRIGIDVKSLYGVEKNLFRRQKNRLQKEFIKQEYSFSFDELCNHINFILQKYEERNKNYIEKIEEYLKKISEMDIQQFDLKQINKKGDKLLWKTIFLNSNKYCE